eukprot:TRINITY_DN3230_c0_g3_i1.p1 TRINITY_DN3230_c0_g3~~TRINITY_DN3230_c0_g3_i1.p1  ORF type:complete len:492 (-),score=130.06 TRINITY_DN3230_c0_g3_i1:1869-3344(-)
MNIFEKQLLVVGSGGIGCEILKNLAMLGFKNVCTVDLDTIDESNLNRQFLFKKEHVGMPKAQVAVEVINKKFSLNYQYFHDKIEDCLSFYDWKKFDVVLNALDNFDSRQYVNIQCVALKIPLIDVGSSGSLGQSITIIPTKTECFACRDKPAPKQYPVCTIRKTPTKPIHCIVWAKSIFQQLFSKEQDKEMEEISKISLEMNIAQLIEQLFVNDILELLKLNSYEKTNEKKPSPIDMNIIHTSEHNIQDPPYPLVQNNLSFEEAFQYLWYGFNKLRELFDFSKDLAFDKDIPSIMWFIIGLTYMRCICFNIDVISPFDIQQIIGNIIPALSTTNALVSAFAMDELLKILNNEEEFCTYLKTYKPGDSRLINTIRPALPNPKCPVCSRNLIELNVLNLSLSTFGDVTTKLEEIYELSCLNISHKANIIYSEDSAFDDEQYGKFIKEMSVDRFLNQLLAIDDFDSGKSFWLVLTNKSQDFSSLERHRLASEVL